MMGFYQKRKIAKKKKQTAVPDNEAPMPSGRSVHFWNCKLRFDSESGQTKDFEIGTNSFPAWRSASMGQCGEQAGEFTCCAVGKGTQRDSPILVW